MAERVIDGALLTLVSLNAAAVVLDTVKYFDQQYHSVFVIIELVSLYVFSLEYLARVWSSVEDARYQQPWLGRLRFMLTPLALLDLLAVLPFFLSLGGGGLRFLRILKVARYVKALHLIEHVIRRKRAELLVAMGVIGVMLLLVSTLMYAVESEAQPDKFGSIPDTMWWGVATLTTVGYGDVLPITPAGKLLSGVIAVLGLGLFAIPTGILASGFSKHIQGEEGEAAVPCLQCVQARQQLAHLQAQLATKDALLASKEETIELLKAAFNRPN